MQQFPNGLVENEIDHVLVGKVPSDIAITPDSNEIHSYRWITLFDLKRELAENPQQFTPWFQEALHLVQISLPSYEQKIS